MTRRRLFGPADILNRGTKTMNTLSLSRLVGRLSVAVVALIAGSAIASSEAMAAAEPPPPPFAIENFVARSLDSVGDDYTVAGGHPDSVEVSFTFPNNPFARLNTVEMVKSTFVDSPAGFTGNVGVTGRCKVEELATGGEAGACPDGTAVGEVDFESSTIVKLLQLYNMVPERGYPAQFGFRAENTIVLLYPRLRPRTGDYGITVATPGIGQLGMYRIKVLLYGVPSQHAQLDGDPPVGGPPLPFLANPVDCLVAEPVTNMFADSWPNPGQTLPAGAADFGSPDLSDATWKSA